MSQVTYPNLQANNIIDPSQLNTNFADVSNMTRGLTNSNMAASAALSSDKLADRFAISILPIELVPFTSGADLNAPASFNVPDSTASPGSEIKRVTMALRTGKSAYLVGARVRCAAEAQVGGADVSLWLTINGIVLGGGAAIINAGGTDFNLLNSSPYDNPYRALGNGDYISVGLGRNNAGGRPTCRGLYIYLFLKVELGA